MDSAPPEVLVLGAGIAGCALAYHLTRQKVSVRVYEPKTPAAGASGRAAGVLTEQLWDRWDVDVARETHREYAELCRQWDPDAYQQNGFVRFTANEAAARAMRDAVDRLRSWGVAVEEPSATDIARWVPGGRFDDVLGAIYYRYDGCVTPSAITTIYAEAARKAGAIFDFGSPMRSVRPVRGGWEVHTDAGTLSGRQLVVAAGAWSKAIFRALGHPQPLSPYRTQAALLRPPGGARAGFPTVHDVDTDVYLRPEAQGRILGGDGTEHTEADPERFTPGGDVGFLEHLAQGLADRYPGWAESEVVASWAGICTSTPDRRPLIGPVPGAVGLFEIVGFNGFGIMRAGAAARRLSDLLAEGEKANAPREALLPVWPGRFVDPPLSFPPRPGFTLEGGDAPRF